MPALFSDPFDALFQFQQTLDALRSSDWLGSSPSSSGSYPPVNVFRKGDDIIVLTEVPGIAKDDLAENARRVREVVRQMTQRTLQ